MTGQDHGTAGFVFGTPLWAPCRWLAMTALVLVAWLCFPSMSALADQQEPVHVRLALRWYHQFQFAGYYAAQMKGYYEEAGLDVEIMDFEPELDTVASVLSGDAQFGVSNSEILLKTMQGEPVVALAAIFQHSPLVFVARADTDVRTPHDLVSHPIRMVRSPRDSELLAMFMNEGIDPDKLNIIEGHVGIEDFFDSNVFGVSAYVTNEPFYLERAGISYNIIYPASYGIDFYGDCLFTSKDYLDSSPETVKAFRNASLRGWRYAMEHQEELINYILSTYRINKTREHLAYEAHTMQDLIMPNLVEIGTMNRGRWERIAQTYLRLGMADTSPDMDSFLYDPDPEPDYGWLWWVLSIAGAVVFLTICVALILFRFYRRLKLEVEERNKAMQALEESEERYRKVMETANDGILLADGTTAMILEANRTLAGMVGRQPGELAGRRLASLFPKAMGAKWERMLLKRDEQFSRQGITGIRLVDATGVELEVEVNASSMELSGKRVFQGIFRDITERRKAEEMIVQTEKMMSVGGLAAGMAHEINNPLGGILQGIQNVERRLSSDLEANRAAARESGVEFEALESYLAGRNIPAMLEDIREAGLRAARIVSNILNFSRKSTSIFEPCDLNELVEEAIGLAANDYDLRKKYDFKRTRINRQFGEDMDSIPCIRTEMLQVLLNLLRNAVQAMSQWGGMDREPEVSITTLRKGGDALILVEDNGPGIDEKTQRRIFEPFFTTKGPDDGTGLGLSVSFFIVSCNHGGAFSVDSRPGKGSRFTIRLPLSQSG